MGQGFVGAATAMGAQEALEAILARRMQERQYADQQRQQQVENQQRAQQIGQGDARIGLDRDELGFRQSAATSAAAEKAAAAEAQQGYLRSLPPEVQPMMQGRLLTGQSISQHDLEPPDQHTAHVQAEEEAKRKTGLQDYEDKEKIQAKYRPPAQQADPNTGWRIQTVTDPNTNKTSMIRVNERTGEVQPVQLPNGVQPGGQRTPRLTSGQQEDLSTMQTVEDLAKGVLTRGEAMQWAGIGGMGWGSAQQLGAKHLGTGTPQEQSLRNDIGNILATIAKLRGGTSFTANEQKLLETYTPTINDSPMMLKSKLQSLTEYIGTKRKNTMKYAGADPAVMAAEPEQGGGGVEYDWVDGKLVPRTP